MIKFIFVLIRCGEISILLFLTKFLNFKRSEICTIIIKSIICTKKNYNKIIIKNKIDRAIFCAPVLFHF